MMAEQGSSISTGRAAERRQVTALSYDLVGSTRLAANLDPEDVRALQRQFHEACSNAIAHYEGHVNRYSGDGAMAYFGYPRAHEDDPERAVRAGLAILRNCHLLDAKKVLPGAEIAVRVGIATGLVVAGTFSGNRTFDQDDVAFPVIQGKYREFSRFWALSALMRRLNNLCLLRFLIEFPTRSNRENLRRNREVIRRNRDSC